MFYGRKEELISLNRLKDKETASLVAILGRRRIGKSALIQKFSEGYLRFIQIQGLAPAENKTELEMHSLQLKHFSKSIAVKFKVPEPSFSDWSEALDYLAELTKKGQTLILLDEISWMAIGDPLFASKLKNIWDLKFKNNKKLILVLCGSVSTWIQKNILSNTNFVGRVSLEINLKELYLNEANLFWSSTKHKISTYEKLMILSVTGGVPKYLEEITMSQTADKNLIKMCFQKDGILHNDFDKIFTDIFGNKRKSLEKIVRGCLNKKITPKELSGCIGTFQNSDFTENLAILEGAGFLSRDYYYKINEEKTRLSQIRLKDNYLRFYLKYIEPFKLKPQKKINKISDLKSFDSILGLQFENLIFNNLDIAIQLMNINSSEILSASPFVQKKNPKNKGACQIDLLIQNEMNLFYLCELKCQKIIDKSILKEVQKKMDVIVLPRRSSLRPVLIYEGEIYPPHFDEINKYFYKMISFEQFLNFKV